MPELASRTAANAPIDTGEKQDYFDRYWTTRDYLRTDRRTMERAQMIWPRLHRRRGRALDVGCGRGLFASFLTEQGMSVDAIDISPQAVEFTGQRGIHAFLLDLEQQSPVGVYDAIFCLEVLQQVRDPELVLKRLSTALAPDGEIIVSVPNEFHLVRRLNTFFGRVDFGGLDDSHLKLFTPLRGENLMRRCGLEVTAHLFPSIVPPQFGFVSSLGRLMSRLWPSLMAISTIYIARKRTS